MVFSSFSVFLKFEILTLVPYDMDLIDKKYLDDKVRLFLNIYNEGMFE